MPTGFEQANTQITTFTGGNPGPAIPRSRTATPSGIVHDATWAEGFAERLTFELTYYNHEIDSGIQALDIQALLNACLAAGGTDADAVLAVHARSSGNLQSA